MAPHDIDHALTADDVDAITRFVEKYVVSIAAHAQAGDHPFRFQIEHPQRGGRAEDNGEAMSVTVERHGKVGEGQPRR